MTAGARQVFSDSVQHQHHQQSWTSMSSANNNNTHNQHSGSSSNSSVDSSGHGQGTHGHGHSQHSILFGQITRTMTNMNSMNNNQVTVLDSANNLNNIMGAGGGIKKTNNKPLMEKRRRARINKSLLELERLIILPNQDLKKGAAAKLEKADILEMTVKYLREICEVQESHANKWKAGFNECAKTVKLYLESHGHFNLSQNLTNHLMAIDNPPPNLNVSSMPDPPVQLELTINCNHSSESELECEPVNLARCHPSENDSMWRPWSLRPSARCYNGFDLSPQPHPPLP